MNKHFYSDKKNKKNKYHKKKKKKKPNLSISKFHNFQDHF